jgi:hypothetical protein
MTPREESFIPRELNKTIGLGALVSCSNTKVGLHGVFLTQKLYLGILVFIGFS